jgi:phosphoribosylanthranilate isomerase
MWVKVCGVRSPVDARACVEAGVDAVGVNLFAGPRRLDVRQAEAVVAALEGRAEAVALVGSEAGGIDAESMAFLSAWGVRCIQVYGGLGPDAAGGLARAAVRVIRPLPVESKDFASGEEFPAAEGDDLRPWAVLLDSAAGRRAGGTGRTFRWEWVKRAREQGALAEWPQVILAGGLTPENVAEAIGVVAPFGVDVSSGVESAAGVKDHVKLREFVEAARSKKV